jgi:hypothetical protein
MEGRRMNIVLAPVSTKPEKKTEAKAAPKAGTTEKVPAKAAAGTAKPAPTAEANVATKEPEHAETKNS